MYLHEAGTKLQYIGQLSNMQDYYTTHSKQKLRKEDVRALFFMCRTQISFSYAREHFETLEITSENCVVLTHDPNSNEPQTATEVLSKTIPMDPALLHVSLSSSSEPIIFLCWTSGSCNTSRPPFSISLLIAISTDCCFSLPPFAGITRMTRTRRWRSRN